MLHGTLVRCDLDGAQLGGHALLLRSHGERRDRGCRVVLAGVGVGGRIGSRVLLLGGGNRNRKYVTDALETRGDREVNLESWYIV